MKKLLTKSLLLLVLINASACVSPKTVDNPVPEVPAPKGPKKLTVTPIKKQDLDELERLSKKPKSSDEESDELSETIEVPYSELTKQDKEKADKILATHIVENFDIPVIKDLFSIMALFEAEEKNAEKKAKNEEQLAKKIDFLNTLDKNKLIAVMQKKLSSQLDENGTALERYQTLGKDMKDFAKTIELFGILPQFIKIAEDMDAIGKKTDLEKAQYLKLDPSIINQLAQTDADAADIDIMYMGKKQTVKKLIDKKLAQQKMIAFFTFFRPDLVALISSKPNATEDELKNLEIEEKVTDEDLEKIQKMINKYKKATATWNKTYILEKIKELNLINHNNNKINTKILAEEIVKNSYTENQLKNFKKEMTLEEILGNYIKPLEDMGNNRVITMLGELGKE